MKPLNVRPPKHHRVRKLLGFFISFEGPVRHDGVAVGEGEEEEQEQDGATSVQLSSINPSTSAEKSIDDESEV